MMSPERAHNLAMAAISRGWVKAGRVDEPALGQTLFGVHFPNPIGLAAGFDKNAQAVDRWVDLGFGFTELGTVTKHAQPGNPKPRLFRLPQDKALINRMGFNNEGASAIQPRLQAAKREIPIGINLGKSKVTPVEDAAKDYAASFALLAPHADYVVVNVSSPNTPGLRGLQEKGPLTEILTGLQAIDRSKPLFVKIAPDLTLGEIDDVIEVVHMLRLTGIIATNTTVDRSGLTRDPGEAGGLSGRPLFEPSNLVLEYLAQSCSRDVILVGVGGIFSVEDVLQKIALGAHLVQIYTGWVYGGPTLIPRLVRETAVRMRSESDSLDALRGSKVRTP